MCLVTVRHMVLDWLLKPEHYTHNYSGAIWHIWAVGSSGTIALWQMNSWGEEWQKQSQSLNSDQEVSHLESLIITKVVLNKTASPFAVSSYRCTRQDFPSEPFTETFPLDNPLWLTIVCGSVSMCLYSVIFSLFWDISGHQGFWWKIVNC